MVVVMHWQAPVRSHQTRVIVVCRLHPDTAIGHSKDQVLATVNNTIQNDLQLTAPQTALSHTEVNSTHTHTHITLHYNSHLVYANIQDKIVQ